MAAKVLTEVGVTLDRARTYDSGCLDAPQVLQTPEDRINSVAGTARFVRTKPKPPAGNVAALSDLFPN
jgi:hypothetical protein